MWFACFATIKAKEHGSVALPTTPDPSAGQIGLSRQHQTTLLLFMMMVIPKNLSASSRHPQAVIPIYEVGLKIFQHGTNFSQNSSGGMSSA